MSRTPAVRKGAMLQREIAGTKLKEGEAALWWLGQATFCLKIGESVVYVDPFYRGEGETPETMQEMPLRPGEMTGGTLICCSHDHLDHTDPLTLPGVAKASSKAPVLLPWLAWEVARKAGVPARRMRVMRGDDAYTAGGLHVTALPSAHMGVAHDPEKGYRYLGYVFQGNGVTIYHPGDGGIAQDRRALCPLHHVHRRRPGHRRADRKSVGATPRSPRRRIPVRRPLKNARGNRRSCARRSPRTWADRPGRSRLGTARLRDP